MHAVTGTMRKHDLDFICQDFSGYIEFYLLKGYVTIFMASQAEFGFLWLLSLSLMVLKNHHH